MFLFLYYQPQILKPKFSYTMSSRFPLNEAPDHDIHEIMDGLLTEIHNGPPPFPVVEDNGEAMLGPYAAFRYTSSFSLYNVIPNYIWRLAPQRMETANHHDEPTCSYTSEMAKAFFIMAKTCYNPSHVKPRNRELAVLALCSVYDAPYVSYCHRNLGKKVGLDPEQIDDALRGREPRGLTDEEAAVYCLARALSTAVGPLEDALFNSIVARMEKSQAVGVANVIGGYRWIVTLVQLNGADHRWE
jgi:hypothetical protein